jgi:hypothetical protein
MFFCVVAASNEKFHPIAFLLLLHRCQSDMYAIPKKGFHRFTNQGSVNGKDHQLYAYVHKSQLFVTTLYASIRTSWKRRRDAFTINGFHVIPYDKEKISAIIMIDYDYNHDFRDIIDSWSSKENKRRQDRFFLDDRGIRGETCVFLAENFADQKLASITSVGAKEKKDKLLPGITKVLFNMNTRLLYVYYMLILKDKTFGISVEILDVFNGKLTTISPCANWERGIMVGVSDLPCTGVTLAENNKKLIFTEKLTGNEHQIDLETYGWKFLYKRRVCNEIYFRDVQFVIKY